MLHQKRLEAVVCRCFTTEVFLEILQNLQSCRPKETPKHLIRKLLIVGCGCSFVAKLSLKKIFFWKNMFFIKYTLFAEKMFS